MVEPYADESDDEIVQFLGEPKPVKQKRQRSHSWGGYSTYAQLTRCGFQPTPGPEEQDEPETPDAAMSDRVLVRRTRRKQKGRKTQNVAPQLAPAPIPRANAYPGQESGPVLLGSRPNEMQTKQIAVCEDREPQTTLAIRNLPYSLSQQDLMQALDDAGFAGLYDFVYLPHKFKEHRNVGFAFVNFIDGQSAERFMSEWQNTHRFAGMRKSVNITPASMQGREANQQKATSRKMERVKNASFRPMFWPAH